MEVNAYGCELVILGNLRAGEWSGGVKIRWKHNTWQKWWRRGRKRIRRICRWQWRWRWAVVLRDTMLSMWIPWHCPIWKMSHKMQVLSSFSNPKVCTFNHSVHHSCYSSHSPMLRCEDKCRRSSTFGAFLWIPSPKCPLYSHWKCDNICCYGLYVPSPKLESLGTCSTSLPCQTRFSGRKTKTTRNPCHDRNWSIIPQLQLQTCCCTLFPSFLLWFEEKCCCSKTFDAFLCTPLSKWLEL